MAPAATFTHRAVPPNPHPNVVVVAMDALLSVVAPCVFAATWPHLVAAGMLAAHAVVYQQWTACSYPGCNVRLKYL